MNGTHPITSI